MLDEIIQDLAIGYEKVAYAGDDLPDLACIKAAKLGITVPNGHAELKKCADYITTRAGGEGAVREICDGILNAQNNYEQAISKFL